MNNYPADGSELERGAWALCTGIDLAMVTLCGIILLVVLVRWIIEGISLIKSRRIP